MKNYIEQILGTTDLASFAAALTFAGLGILLSLLLHAKSRDKHSDNTPVNFSWGFLIRDNVQRIATSLLLIFVGIRFSKELLGMEFTMYTALIVGFMLDKVAQILKSVTIRARS